jgi:hypothetical protein
VVQPVINVLQFIRIVRKIKVCIKYQKNKSNCHYPSSDLPTKRGCVSKLTVVSEVAACSTSTDNTCSVCEENNCNILAHEDHVCRSCSTESVSFQF